MALPTTAITRYELSAPFSEFDLQLNQRRFIGPRILRPRLVALQSANIGKIPLKVLLQEHKTKRAPGGGYGRGDFEFEKFSYATEEFGWEEPLDDRTLSIYRDILDAEGIHAERAIGFVIGEFERDVAAAVHNTAVWTGAALATDLTTPWSDHAEATPIDDILAAREKIVEGSGLEPNCLQINSLQWRHLINCDQIVDRIKYSAEATAEKMRAAVAEVLDVEMIVVAGGLTNTANPQQSAAISRIWSNDKAMLCRVAQTDDPQEPCIGRTFIWSGDGPGAAGTDEELAVLVEEYREEGVRASVLRARNDRDIVIMHPQAGHLLTSVIGAE